MQPRYTLHSHARCSFSHQALTSCPQRRNTNRPTLVDHHDDIGHKALCPMSGCVRMRPTRCGAGPGCSYKAPGALERHPALQLDLKCSCVVSPPPRSFASFPAPHVVAGHKRAGQMVEKEGGPARVCDTCMPQPLRRRTESDGLVHASTTLDFA